MKIGSAPTQRPLSIRDAVIAVTRWRAFRRLVTATPPGRNVVQRFIAGESLDDAMPVMRMLVQQGFAITADLVGESVTSAVDAEMACQGYVEVIRRLHADGLEPSISVKPTQLGIMIDRSLCRANVERLASEAARLGGFVRLDMEDRRVTESTLELGAALHAEHGNVGVVLQANLRRSLGDAEEIAKKGIPVRLCKGAYREDRAEALARRRDVDKAFYVMMKRFITRGTPLAVATHDPDLLNAATALREGSTVPDRTTFEMLYGVRRDLQADLHRRRLPIRIYVPFGPDWYAYFVRRLVERPANVLFLVRVLVFDRHPPTAPDASDLRKELFR